MNGFHQDTKPLAIQIGLGIILPAFFLSIEFLTNNNVILAADFILVVLYVIYSFKTVLKMDILRISRCTLSFGIASAGLILLIQLTLSSITGIKGGSNQLLYLNPLISAPIACLTGPLWEELIFRYTLNVKYFQNKCFGILVSSILFALLHGSTRLVDIFVYFFIGVILSFTNWQSHNLLSSVLAHSLTNTFVFIGSL